VFCTCEIIQLFSVVRAAHKFDFRLVINKTPNNGQPVERSKSDQAHVFDTIYMFSPTVVASVKRRCATDCIFMSKRQ
jgi:hypothetical protein